jgi:hypothetical protein
MIRPSRPTPLNSLLQFFWTQLVFALPLALLTEFRTWCRTDPVVQIGSQNYNVEAAVDAGDGEASVNDHPQFIFYTAGQSFTLIDAGTFDGVTNNILNTPQGSSPKVRVGLSTSPAHLPIEVRVNGVLKVTDVTNHLFDVPLS